MTQQGFCTKLKNRGQIRISGPQARAYLQRLITADINRLGNDCALLYSCLLTPNGKFLYDFFIREVDSALYLDCEGGERAESLAKTLNAYKLRSEISIECEPESPVYTIWGSSTAYEYPDPRNTEMGGRIYAAPEEKMLRATFSQWDRYRIERKIPDGSRDMPPQTATLLEYGIDLLGGISWEKGCYMGQELTARMRYRGLTKKHIVRVNSQSLPEPGTPLFSKDTKLQGEMRSSCDDVGLALIKKDCPVTELFSAYDQSNAHPAITITD